MECDAVATYENLVVTSSGKGTLDFRVVNIEPAEADVERYAKPERDGFAPFVWVDIVAFYKTRTVAFGLMTIAFVKSKHCGIIRDADFITEATYCLFRSRKQIIET